MAEPQTETRMRSVLEDPGAQAVARMYADSFLSGAGGDPDGAIEEFRSFRDDVLEAFPEFGKAFLSHLLGRDEKLGLIDRVVAPRSSERFANFLRVLARHDRLDLLPTILREAGLARERQKNMRRVRVASARPLSDASQAGLAAMLRGKFGFEPIIEPETDEALLGGVVVQIGDTVYDGSLRTRLRQLRDRLRQRSLHEVQSGRDRFGDPAGN